MKLSWAAPQLDQDATLQLEPVSFRNKFCEVSLFNPAQISKWKDQQIAWCEDKGEPSERLATHHTAAATDPERWVALISPDSTRWHSVAQSSPDSRTYVCVGQAAVAAASNSSNVLVLNLWNFTVFQEETHDWWGPVVGGKVGCVFKAFSKEKSWIVQLKIIKPGTNSIILYRWYWTFIHHTQYIAFVIADGVISHYASIWSN